MMMSEDSEIDDVRSSFQNTIGNIENTKPITIAKKLLANWETNNITYGFTHLITS